MVSLALSRGHEPPPLFHHKEGKFSLNPVHIPTLNKGRVQPSSHEAGTYSRGCPEPAPIRCPPDDGDELRELPQRLKPLVRVRTWKPWLTLATAGASALLSGFILDPELTPVPWSK